MLVIKIAAGVFIGGFALLIASVLAFQVITNNAGINERAARTEVR